MSKSYKAIDVALLVVSTLIDHKIYVNSYRLQRILYLLYKDYYKRYGELLFSDVWESWLVGPVVCDVYKYFLAWGAININTLYRPIKNVITDGRIISLLPKAIEYSMLSRDELQELTKDKAYQLARESDNIISPSRIILNIEK